MLADWQKAAGADGAAIVADYNKKLSKVMRRAWIGCTTAQRRCGACCVLAIFVLMIVGGVGRS